MALFLGDFLLLLLPCLLLTLLSAALRWSGTRRWTDCALEAAGRRLWIVVCWILKLPLRNDTEAGSAGAPAGSALTPDGPRLVCKPTALARFLLRHCGCLAGPGPRGDPHLQTVRSQLWEQRERALQFTRDHLLLRDGGVVALDWAVGTRVGEAAEGRRRKEHHAGGKALGCFTAAPPVLLLIPQCWGGMTPHLRALCRHAMRQGFYVVVFHPRGTAGCPLATARITEFGDPADLEQAVSYIRSRLPSSTLVAVSEGSGSGVLLSYLGESGSGTQLTAAAAISPVLLGQRWFEAAMPPLYRWGALFQRKRPLRRYASSFRAVLDVDRALRCSSLRDLEETLFCSSSSSPPPCSRPPSRGRGPPVAWALGERAFPAEDWGGYWERNEPLRDADDVAVPLLCICSRDDPLLPPPPSLPLHLFQSSPFFLLLLTDRGGHCGFALREAGPGGEEEEEEEQPGGGVWSHAAVLEYFKVVADFLKVGEREASGWGGPQEENIQALLRSRGINPAPLRKRRPPVMRRPRPPAASFEDAEETFTWRRSYTR